MNSVGHAVRRDPLVVVDELVKTYPVRRGLLQRFGRHAARYTVIKGISFSVGRGELLGVLGANGAGKTTLLHSLAALAYWDSGTITIDGVDARAHPMAIRRMVGLSTVGGAFYGRLTVRDNLRFFGTLCDVPARALERRIDEVLSLVDLADRDRSNYFTLSTGMRQRLNVARALLADPRVLLLDEPTRAVDPVNAEILRNFIRQTLVTQLGKTVILATNLLEEAWTLCDRVAILREGHIAAMEHPRVLQHAAGIQRYRIVVDHAGDAYLARLRAVPHLTKMTTSVRVDETQIDVEVAQAEFSLTSLLRAVSTADVDVRSFSFEGTSPADVFAALTAKRP
ncbi:MAG: hypothetical protein NVSMB19_01440 [Vulcanimicrobiaceae bacterium]